MMASVIKCWKEPLMPSSPVDSRQLSGFLGFQRWRKEGGGPWLLSLHPADPTTQAPRPLETGFCSSLFCTPRASKYRGWLEVHMTLPRAALPSPLPPNQQSHVTYRQATNLGHLCHHPRSATTSSSSLFTSSLFLPSFWTYRASRGSPAL